MRREIGRKDAEKRRGRGLRERGSISAGAEMQKYAGQALTIRQADTSDAPALAALAVETYVEAFGHSFSPDDLAAHL